MTTPMSVQVADLRAAAATLRDDVTAELRTAIGTIPHEHADAVHGPTAGPAAGAFGSSWRAELDAVLAAVEQLATALDDSATTYERADRESAVHLQTAR